MHCSRRLIVQTLVFSRSPPETLVVKGGTTWARNGRWILPENARLPCNIQGSFTCCKSMTWDKWLYFPSEGRHAEDFFALKKPTASAGFEPANLGTKGQHTTSRPPKPLIIMYTNTKILTWERYLANMYQEKAFPPFFQLSCTKTLYVNRICVKKLKICKNYYYFCLFSLWEADMLNMGRFFLLLCTLM